MIIATGSIALDTTRTPFQTIKKASGGAAHFSFPQKVDRKPFVQSTA